MIRQTDHTMPACDPSSCAGAVPARDRLRIVLQYSGERTYNALALRLGLKRSENLYRIRKGYNGISMDLALRIRNICPSLSLSWLLGGEGDPEAPDRTSAEAASAEVLYVPLYPDLLSWDRDFSAWGRSASSVSFLVVSRGRGGRLLPGDCMLLARTPAEFIVFGRAYVVVVGEARLCRIIRKDESPERVRLVSLKPDKYDEIAVPRTEIDGLYRICGTFRYWAD
mgnify:CR=1 FL=1